MDHVERGLAVAGAQHVEGELGPRPDEGAGEDVGVEGDDLAAIDGGLQHPTGQFDGGLVVAAPGLVEHRDHPGVAQEEPRLVVIAAGGHHSLGSPVINSVDEGDYVKILAHWGNWYKIKIAGPDGWVKASVLDFDYVDDPTPGPNNVQACFWGPLGYVCVNS